MDGESCCGVDLDKLAANLRVLAEPNRMRIVRLLMEGVQCNCRLGDQLNMPANLISHHLHILLESGLVRVERASDDGRWLYYSIDPDALADLTRLFGAFFDPGRIQPRLATCGPAAGAEPGAKKNRRCRKC